MKGRADLTQKYSKYVMDTWYTDQPNGMPGNDDFVSITSHSHKFNAKNKC